MLDLILSQTFLFTMKGLYLGWVVGGKEAETESHNVAMAAVELMM